MPTFFTISPVRKDLSKYEKNNSYSNCCDDLCNFFKDKDIETIYNRPEVLHESTGWKYMKSRIENSNNGKGKSSGYRIYYYVDREKETIVILGFYPKTGKYGKSDISESEAKVLIKTYREELKREQLISHDLNKFAFQEA